MQPRAAYIHVPFCRHRCGYCNFTVVAGHDDLVGAYQRAIATELSWLGTPREVDTLFIGGGTPTHLSPAELAGLLDTVRHWHPLSAGGEFSVEANPADITAEKIAILADAGVTRLSLGVQSFDNAKLAILERDHRAADIERAVAVARQRMEAISLDLIFAVPGETLAVWQSDLRAALKLAPDHLSTYGLTWEKGTTFWSRLLKQELDRADEDVELSMYEWGIDALGEAGFEHYEVSNFARSGRRCRHNETYWGGESYYAAGPGAARFIAGRRETNHRSFWVYLKRVNAGQSPVAESETLSPEDRARELLVFGLRRLEGVSLTWFRERTQYDVMALGGEPLRRFLDWGLLELHAGMLRLTRRGLVVSDSLWPELLG